MEKIILENVYEQKKKKLGLKFNPGLALIGPRTTGPWLSHLLNVETCSIWYIKIVYSIMWTIIVLCHSRYLINKLFFLAFFDRSFY